MIRILACIPAHEKSKRLPGKVLLELGNKTALEHTIQRARRLKGLSGLVVCVPNEEENRNIRALVVNKKLCNYISFNYCDKDVLLRLLTASIIFKATHVMRICPDAPFFCIEYAQQLIDMVPNNIKYHYFAHWLKDDKLPTVANYALGTFTEIVSVGALVIANIMGDAEDHEHVTKFVYEHPDIFDLKKVELETLDNIEPLTLDTQEDYEKLKKLVKERRL